MAILLIAEHDNATLSDQTAKALSAATQIGSDIDVLVAGKDAKPAADAAAKLKGVRKVLLAEATNWPSAWRSRRRLWSSRLPATTTRSSRRPHRRARTSPRASLRCSMSRKCRKSSK